MPQNLENVWAVLLTERLTKHCFALYPVAAPDTLLAVTRLYLAELTARQPARISVETATALLDELVSLQMLKLEHGRCRLTELGMRRGDTYALLDPDDRESVREAGEAEMRRRVIPPVDSGPLSDDPGSPILRILRSTSGVGELVSIIVRDVIPRNSKYSIAGLRTALMHALPSLLGIAPGMLSHVDADAAIRFLLEEQCLEDTGERSYVLTRKGRMAESFSRGEDEPEDLDPRPAPVNPRTIRAALANNNLGAEIFTSLLRTARRNYAGGIDVDDVSSTICDLAVEYELDTSPRAIRTILEFFVSQHWLRPVTPIGRRVESYNITASGRVVADVAANTGT